MLVLAGTVFGTTEAVNTFAHFEVGADWGSLGLGFVSGGG